MTKVEREDVMRFYNSLANESPFRRICYDLSDSNWILFPAVVSKLLLGKMKIPHEYLIINGDELERMRVIMKIAYDTLFASYLHLKEQKG